MSWFKKSRIYLDHASATPVLPEALDAVRAASEYFGNPGAIHAEAVAAKASLQNSRERVALELGCKAREVIFTSGLTEGNNIAILGVARKMLMEGKELKGTHWITTSIEHASVLEPFAEVERLGGTVTHIDPEANGVVSVEKFSRALREETVFVSICWGNNEIGTIQPLSKISAAIRAHEKAHGTTVFFHSDAGQAPLYLHPQVHTLGVDMLSLGSGKLYGPRGTGALYLNNRVAIAGVVVGGGQERGIKSGTEDVALAAGFAEAFTIIGREREREWRRLEKMRDDFARHIVARVPGVIVNGDLRHALPHMLNISIPNINSEMLVLSLDREGVATSTKSACNEGESASHVIAALGGEEWRAQNTLRISFGRDTNERDLDTALEALVVCVGKSR